MWNFFPLFIAFDVFVIFIVNNYTLRLIRFQNPCADSRGVKPRQEVGQMLIMVIIVLSWIVNNKLK